MDVAGAKEGEDVVLGAVTESTPTLSASGQSGFADVDPLEWDEREGPPDLPNPPPPPPKLSDIAKLFEPVFDEAGPTCLPPLRPHYDCKIELEAGTSPPFLPILALTEAESEELRRALDDLLARGFIRASKSPAGAPIIFAKKKDGAKRMCVDYRRLNAITVKNRHPIPLISEILNRVQGAKYFSKLDLHSAYHLLRIARGDEWKTAFRTKYGHFE